MMYFVCLIKMESLQPYKDQNKLVTRSAFAAILQATATLTAQPDRSNSHSNTQLQYDRSLTLSSLRPHFLARYAKKLTA